MWNSMHLPEPSLWMRLKRASGYCGISVVIHRMKPNLRQSFDTSKNADGRNAPRFELYALNATAKPSESSERFQALHALDESKLEYFS